MSWVPLAQAAALAQVNERTVRIWVKRGRIEARVGVRGREVNVESLKQRLRLADETDAVPGLLGVPDVDRPALLKALADAYEVIRAMRALPARSDHRHQPTPAFAALLFRLAGAIPVPLRRHVLPHLRRDPISHLSLRRVLSQARGPLELLARRAPRGRAKLLPPDAKAAICETFARGGAGAAKVPLVHRAYLVEAPERGWPAVSIWTVRRTLDEAGLLDPKSAEFVYRRKGARVAEATVLPYLERDRRRHEPGDEYCGDHHELDVAVRCERTGEVYRPWLTAWVDDRLELFVGWKWSRQPNSDTIAAALVHACIRKALPGYDNIHGLPRGVLTDNGKDYKARRFLGDGECDVGAFEALGIEFRNAKIYNAKDKIIERRFGDVATDFARSLPGYVGNVPTFESCNETEQLRAHKAWFEGAPGAPRVSPLLTLAELEQRWEWWLARQGARIDTVIQSREGRPVGALALWDLLIVDADTGRHRLTRIDEQTMFLCLLRSTKRQVRRGYVQVDRKKYFHRELALRHLQDVRVAVDPGDDEQAYIWQGRQFVCLARGHVSASEIVRAKRATLHELKRLSTERQELAAPIDLMPKPVLLPPAAVVPESAVTRLVPHADQVRVVAAREERREETQREAEEARSAFLASLRPPAKDHDTDDLEVVNELRRRGLRA